MYPPVYRVFFMKTKLLMKNILFYIFHLRIAPWLPEVHPLTPKAVSEIRKNEGAKERLAVDEKVDPRQMTF